MSVLSDQEIRTRMANGELVPSGDPDLAAECSYSFLPGCAFLAGHGEASVDFPGSDGRADITVRPGQMVWIRTRDTVRMPSDLVGFWWQTNSLSRKGLMLVNMSMVEPGYVGDLACLFVNFGKADVLINARTVIAKMVFVRMEGQVLQPYAGALDRFDYDMKLRELAIAQPRSFLQVAELSSDLREAQAAALEEIRSVGMSAKAEMKTALQDAKKEVLKEFKEDTPGVLKRSFALVLGLFAILTLASLAADYAKDKLIPDVKDVARTEAERVLKERVVINGVADPDGTTKLNQKLDEISHRLKALETKP